MIVYGFYGTGKTAICEQCPEKYLDLDFQYFRFEEAYFFDAKSAEAAYKQRIQEQEAKYDIVFINHLPEGLKIDAGYIQSDYKACVKALAERKQGNFIPLKEEYDNVVLRLREMGSIVFLDSDEHISDALDLAFTRKDKAMDMNQNEMKSLDEQIAELEKLNQQMEALQSEIESRKAEIEAQQKAKEDAQKQKYLNICLDAIIVGTDNFKARHGSIAPYTNGYYIQSHNNVIKREFCEPVTASSFEKLPEVLYHYLKNIAGWTDKDFAGLKRRTDADWKALPKSYTPNYYQTQSSEYLHGHHIATGYEIDGFDNIVKERLGGTYSSMTTGSQNDLAVKLIALKGYCTEYYLQQHPKEKPFFKEVFKRHGIDCRLGDLNKWAERNPSRCMSDNPHYSETAPEKKTRSRHKEDRDL